MAVATVRFAPELSLLHWLLVSNVGCAVMGARHDVHNGSTVTCRASKAR